MSVIALCASISHSFNCGQGFVGAVSRYVGLRSMMSLLGPMLWGTFLADVVIQMLGTDYARILRAIYAFAQIRITRTYRLPCDND
ncbi:hypothetical protein OIU74_016384 [Salix koriyanagi]|uniref:Uncharacterized protein n=1 Tax=Salix koriyanagi TaxID=2511006 RepID=A0A9Q0PGK7_9ROSI|nr:hypothetical protein OIU74_016384 [Salix koriyanagi]